MMFIMFATTSKGIIMEIRSLRSFSAIPATLIKGVFNLYLTNLLCKLYCKYFVYLFALPSYHCKFFISWQIFTYLPT